MNSAQVTVITHVERAYCWNEDADYNRDPKALLAIHRFPAQDDSQNWCLDDCEVKLLECIRPFRTSRQPTHQPKKTYKKEKSSQFVQFD